MNSIILIAFASLANLIHGSPVIRQTTDVSQCKLAADPSALMSEGFGFISGSAPSTGTLNARMFFVDFPDAIANDTTQSLYDVFLPNAADWYQTSSNGLLDLQVQADTSQGFVRMPSSAASYGWQPAMSVDQQMTLFQDAFDSFAAMGGDTSSVDTIYIVPTTAASSAFTFSSTIEGVCSTRSGTIISTRCTLLSDELAWDDQYKVMNHETGHAMGLPDMYSVADGSAGYVGGWDVMSNPAGPSPDYIAWDKWRLGWIDDSSVDCVTTSGSSTHTLSPMDSFNAGDAPIKVVVITRGPTDALVAEVRSLAGNDQNGCSQGVLIYTVSTTTASGEGPVVVLDGNPNSGGCDGDELGDAPLTFANPNGGASSLTTQDGVNITVTGQSSDDYTIQVVVP